MSGNYDYPPASSRRPSRPSGTAPSDSSRRPSEHFRQIIDNLHRNNSTYDYPPASSRAPSRPSGTAPSVSSRRPSEHFRQIIDNLHRNNSTSANDEHDSSNNLVELRAETQATLQRLIDLHTQHHNEYTALESPGSIGPARERLAYLRRLVESGGRGIGADDAARALEVLNQEFEQQHLDATGALESLNREIEERGDASARANFVQTRAVFERQLDQLRLRPPASTDGSHRSWIEQSRPFRPPTLSPASTQELRPPSIRSLRRRPFRPDLRSLSNLSELPPFPSLMPQPPQTDRNGRRQKRRKLESDDNREGFRGFNYGHYGQVVPGALKMEIASCDGGIYDPEGDSSFPENVLRNDSSVYCTKSDRCNLVLRHRDEAPFCLKKIVIKAPRSGFDSPIQEGMIFVSMTSDELLARTAQYQIQYSSAGRRRRNRRTGMQPSQEYLTAFRSPLQSLERTVLLGPDSSSALDDNENADRNADDPQAEFRVTTEYEDSEDNVFVERDDDDEPSIAELERIEGEDDLCSDSEDSASEDEDNEDTGMSNNSRHRTELQRRAGSIRRQYSDPTSGHRQAPGPGDPSPAAASGSGGASNTEVLKPHARFFIEREKSMVSIKFDPPPSGRFILVKLWSPRSDGNIDIQSIIAHGYAGPRFFPSCGFR